jgi:hypothetical protein
MEKDGSLKGLCSGAAPNAAEAEATANHRPDLPFVRRTARTGVRFHLR